MNFFTKKLKYKGPFFWVVHDNKDFIHIFCHVFIMIHVVVLTQCLEWSDTRYQLHCKSNEVLRMKTSRWSDGIIIIRPMNQADEDVQPYLQNIF